MVTKDNMRKALKEAFSQCQETPCIHAHALSENIEGMIDVITAATEEHSNRNIDPTVSSFYAGLHVGYRLGQLEYENVNPKDMN